jgi:hypothetical protein
VSATSELARCSSEAVERVGAGAALSSGEKARASQRIQGYNDVIVFAVRLVGYHFSPRYHVAVVIHIHSMTASMVHVQVLRTTNQYDRPRE